MADACGNGRCYQWYEQLTITKQRTADAYPMTQYTLPGSPEVAVILRRSARAKRLSLRVSRLKGTVTLTVPKFARDHEARGFVEEKADWIRKHLSDIPQPMVATLGAVVPVAGQDRLIAEKLGLRKIRLVDGAIQVPMGCSCVPARVSGLLKTLARDRLSAASDYYAAQLGRDYTTLTLRDTRSRWGSCSSEGRLMYSWRLIMAPAAVLDYVAAHEVAHLQEMNHGAGFWHLVEEMMPSYQTHRAWLRHHGESLHRFQFTNPAH